MAPEIEVADTIKSVDFANHITGSVDFDFGLIKDANYGVGVIKGKLPRIRPRHQRKPLTPQQEEFVTNRLMKWGRKYFPRGSIQDDERFDILVGVVARCCSYVNPFQELESKGMELFTNGMFWYWNVDDYMEDLVASKVPFQTIESGVVQLVNVFDGVTEFKEVPDCPSFKHHFDAFVTLHQDLEVFSPKYKRDLKPMRDTFRYHQNAMRWSAVEEIDGRFTSETFKIWRRILSFFDGITELLLLCLGVTIPIELRECPTVRRLVDIINSSGGFMNDILGLRKEIKDGKKDNFVHFLVCQKKIPVEEAVRDVCNLVNEEYNDWILIRNIAFKEFSYHPMLIKLIDVMESLVDGHCRIYDNSKRYHAYNEVKYYGDPWDKTNAA